MVYLSLRSRGAVYLLSRAGRSLVADSTFGDAVQCIVEGSVGGTSGLCATRQASVHTRVAWDAQRIVPIDSLVTGS
jgi:hypothetical protein